MNSITGNIFEIQRFSIHDGPGIRTTVFLKGCPLRCLWCHNPEGVNISVQLSFIPAKCIDCGYCFRVCPNGAHQKVDGQHILDRDRCKVCGKCTIECYSGALELIGRNSSVDEVIAKVLRDKPFYETSGGGMTLSGGEPLMQIDFSEALLKAAKQEGLNCCVETSGQVNFSSFERVIPYVDLFLFDIKEMIPEKHVEFTGASNKLILENLRQLYKSGARILLRLPMIPGYNDHIEHFEKVVQLKQLMPDIVGIEIMPYHNLGTSKIDRLGLGGVPREESVVPDNLTINGWIDQFEILGVTVRNLKK